MCKADRLRHCKPHSNLDLIAFAQGTLEQAGAKTRLTYDSAKTKANVFATLGHSRMAAMCSLVTPMSFLSTARIGPVILSQPNSRRMPLWAWRRRYEGIHRFALALLPEFAALNLKRPLHFAFSSTKKWLRRRAATAARPRHGPDSSGACRDREPTNARSFAAHKAGAVIETLVRAAKDIRARRLAAQRRYDGRRIHRFLGGVGKRADEDTDEHSNRLYHDPGDMVREVPR